LTSGGFHIVSDTLVDDM